MKRSSIWFASILTACALLPSAANADKPNPRPTVHREAPLPKERKSHPTATQTETATPCPTGMPKPTEPTVEAPEPQNIATKVQENSKPERGRNSESTTRFGLELFFTFVTTVATCFLARFTFQLVRVTRDLHTATLKGTEVAAENVKAAKSAAAAAEAGLEFTKTANEQNIKIASESAEAAKRNVEVAKLGLRTNRPYIIVEECKLVGMPDSGPVPIKVGDTSVAPVAGNIAFRNFGKGAAIIDSVVGRLTLVPTLPAPKDFVNCQQMFTLKAAIRPDEQVKMLSPFLDTLVFKAQEECEAVMQRKLTLIFYGCIRYRDVFEETYETGFLWTYIPPAVGGIMAMTPFLNKGFIVRGPDSHNYRT